MGKNHRTDPAWKYGKEIEKTGGDKKSYVYIECMFCQKTITGGVKRMKEHLACTHKNVAPCPGVPMEVKEEIVFCEAYASIRLEAYASPHNEKSPHFLVAMADLSLRKTAVEERRARVQKESKELLDYTRKAIARLLPVPKHLILDRGPFFNSQSGKKCSWIGT